LPGAAYYKPRAVPLTELEEVSLTLDECEALRLSDLEGMYQEEAAIKMNVSRPTFGRIIAEAHRKIANAIINGKAIRIEGGMIKMANKRAFKCSDCEHVWEVAFGTGRPHSCPSCGKNNIHRLDGLCAGGRGAGRQQGRRGRGMGGHMQRGGNN